jgi:hypothetical protein
MCERIVADREGAFASRVARPPRHLNSPDDEKKTTRPPKQTSFLE